MPSNFFPLVTPNFVATLPASFARNWEIFVRPRGGGEAEQVQVFADEEGAAKLAQPLYTGPAGRIGEGGQFGWVKGTDLPVDLWGRPKGRTNIAWQVLPEGDQAVVAGGAAVELAESKASKEELATKASVAELETGLAGKLDIDPDSVVMVEGDENPVVPLGANAVLFTRRNGESLVEVVLRLPGGTDVVVGTQAAPKPVTVTLEPTEIHEETPGSTAWTNPKNLLKGGTGVASVTAGGSGAIAELGLAGFKANEVIPVGATITAVKAVYRVKVKAGEGNPIVGFNVKSGATFRPGTTEIEGASVPTTMTTIETDITNAGSKTGWTIAELEDGAPIYLRIRCRNNTTGKTSAFEWEHPAALKVTYKPPVPGSLLILHRDTVASADPGPIFGEPNSGPSSTRYTSAGVGGDTRSRLDGTASDGKLREVLIKDGDRPEGDSTSVERVEFGHNERRFGAQGGAGTFALFEAGHHYRVGVSYYLEPSAVWANEIWYVITQFKQAEPYTKNDLYPDESPIIALQARQNKFELIVQPEFNESDPLWTMPIVTGRWVRFVYDIVASTEAEGKGSIRVQVDDREGTPTDFKAQHDSGVMAHHTLVAASGAQSGSGWSLADGAPIPGHLRLGQYRSASINGEVKVKYSLIEYGVLIPT